jgi:hypothetical protein
MLIFAPGAQAASETSNIVNKTSTIIFFILLTPNFFDLIKHIHLSCRCEEDALPDEAIPCYKEIASGTPALAGGAREEHERPRNDMAIR